MDENTQRRQQAARRIMRMNFLYFQSKVLQSAVELGVFDLVADQPATAGQICERLGLHPRLAGDFLDALAGLDLLDRTDGRYGLAPGLDDVLLPSGDRYIGHTIRSHARRHFRAWSELTATLRDGEARSGLTGGTEGFLKLYQNPAATAEMLNHADVFNSFVAPGLVEGMDWSDYRSFVDIAGARGNVAARLVAALPGRQGHVFDLPPLEPLFDELMRERGTTGRVQFHAGDFLTDPLPEADVAIIGHVLHDWPPEYRQKIIDRTFGAVRDGGALLIYDPMIDNDRRAADALLQSLNCRVVSNGGSEYTVDECRAMVEHAGYRYDTVVDLATLSSDRLVIARKDA
jgi:hypothetical protein